MKNNKRKWFKSKELCDILHKEYKISIVSIKKSLKLLTEWNEVIRKRDEEEIYGYLYKVKEKW
jgi:hypothetical protein